MRIRPILVLVLGMSLAGGSVIVTHTWLKNARQVPGEAIAATDPKFMLTDIVVAKSNIAFGQEIQREMVVLQPWPKDALPHEPITSLEAVLGEGKQPGRRAKRAIAAGEPLIGSKLAGFGEKVTIAQAIEAGKRAMAIKVNDVTGVAGFVTPGDRVDVLLTRQMGDNNRDMRTDTILQNITVRGVDQIIDEDRDKPAVVRTVTVEVTPAEAQKLALAQQAGTLGLTLRNFSNEQDKAGLVSVRLGDLVPEKGGQAATRRPEVTVNRGGARTQVEVRN